MNLGDKLLEKRAILYTSAKLEDAQIKRENVLDQNYNKFGDDDIK